MTCKAELTDSTTGYSVFFEDNGRVGYAYLRDPAGTFVGDVWLYNRCETPEDPEWRDREKLPFANPAGFARDHGDFAPVNDASEVTVTWVPPTANKVRACVFVRGELFGVLEDGAKPGWARPARKDGPLAKVLPPDAPYSSTTSL